MLVRLIGYISKYRLRLIVIAWIFLSGREKCVQTALKDYLHQIGEVHSVSTSKENAHVLNVLPNPIFSSLLIVRMLQAYFDNPSAVHTKVMFNSISELEQTAEKIELLQNYFKRGLHHPLH